MKPLKLTGQVFGRLTVIDCSGVDKYGRMKWRCMCACGNEEFAVSGALTSGRKKSCGCLKLERSAAGKTSDFLLRTKSRVIWRNMIHRCHNEVSQRFDDYGGRGIRVCDEWRNSWEAFFVDMGPPPDGKSLDRIDNDLGYSKDNCRWASSAEQAANRRNNVLCVIADADGVNRACTVQEAASALGVSIHAVYGRMKRGSADVKKVLPGHNNL